MVLKVLGYIFAVIAIIVVGAIIIYGLGNLMLAIIDPHAKDKKQQEEKKEEALTYEQPKMLEDKHEEVAVKEEPAEEAVNAEDVKDVDLDKASEEEAALNQANNFAALAEEEKLFEEQKEEVKEEPAEEDINIDDIFVDEEEVKEPEQPTEEPAVEEVKEEPAEETVEIKEEPADEETDEDIEALISKILAESDVEEEEKEEPATEEEKEEPAEEVKEESNELEDEIKALKEELARQKEEYEAKLVNAIAETEELKNQNANAEDKDERIAELEAKLQQASENKNGPTLSLEEYEARLEVLKERLRLNEKELKNVKKEYLPLAKIKKSCERDKTKLRRKEALVAKQKVVLYGVNNYVDIDEEKAKKLQEDLDLLDGLRVSVQNCEEILKANEERYPILESSFNNLTATNENIKADIAECQAKIDQLKNEQ